jgi:hypothetical protein
MIALPPSLAPPPPFPLVVDQVATAADIAPGMRSGTYTLATNDGPLVVHVVAIDPHEPTVRFGTVVAHDRMISSGETVSSMAARTGAVAGINADYFDISSTNQPLNVVVRDGVLERTPSRRVALSVSPQSAVTIGYVGFAGTATYGTAQLPLTAVNEWPPQGGAALLTAAYGTLAATPGIVVVSLSPVAGIAGAPGAYRVTAAGPAVAGPVVGTLLALGPAAQKMAAPPAPGDIVTLAFDTTPPVASMVSAVGGGPLLVAHGAPADDPFSPAPEETNVRFPVAGAGVEADGTLLFVVVDGRKPAVSIGLTRPQFGALMRGLGAVDAMAFDSGGSATLVARVLGDAGPSVLNDPSDGRERPVADGLFAYSDAPLGIHPHLIVRPATVVAYRGASVPLRAAIVDDGGHRIRAADVPPLLATGPAGDRVTTLHERNGAYSVTVPYRVVDRIATLAIAPDRPNPPAGVVLPLQVHGYDAHGTPIALDGVAVRWTALGVVSDVPQFAYATTHGDAVIGAALGGATASVRVRVGSHVVPVTDAETALAYDFTGTARAAYANTAIDLPGEPTTFALDVLGAGDGVPLRAAFLNRYGERRAVTLAAHVDWLGWQHVTVPLPPDLNPPIRLMSLYVVPSLGGPPVRAAGTLRFRALSVVLPGAS